ncbi:MAG: aldose 1-epimerase, partial [Planctomycetota bacterium]
MAADVVRITDPQTGSTADVLISQGCNCFSWRPQLSDGPREMLWASDGFASGEHRPSSSGIPLLFPFPGRIGGAEFEFEGETYRLPPGDPHGNAIHGFTFTRAWRTVDQDDSSVTAEFQGSVDAPETLDSWPSDYHLRVQYRVDA